MAAAQLPDLSGTGIDAGPRPVWIQGATKKQMHLVHPNYLARAHTKADLEAVVTQGGIAITEGGETLTVGLVPPYRRYAIGPVIDGKAEALSQDDFVREHRIVYEAHFQFQGKSPDDADKRYIPNVRTFLAVKLDPMQPGRICPLGTHVGKQAVKTTDRVYDPVQDAFTIRQVNETEARLRDEIAAKDARLEALELKVNALVGRAPEPAKEKAKPATVTMKCGSEVNPSYSKNHIRFCKKGCQEA